MPFGSTWSEELVAEWLDLEGYFVKMQIPAGSAGSGGRYAPDIVGVRFENDELEILHVEVGMSFDKWEKAEKRLKKKFSREIEESITNYVLEKLGLSKNTKINYRRLVVSLHHSKEALKKIEEENLAEIMFIQDVIDEILTGIETGKYHSYESKIKNPTLPNHLWLAKMLENIHESYELKRKEKSKHNKKLET